MVSEHRLINKIKQTGTSEGKRGSGKLRTATTEESKQYIAEMIASQEECHGTHKSQRQIASQLNVSAVSAKNDSEHRLQKHLKGLGFRDGI